MGFSVRIEADWGSEVLRNWHPDGKLTGGKAVFAFWASLNSYCLKLGVIHFDEWFERLDRLSPELLCIACRAFIECAWGDAGDHTHYGEDDFEFYKKRHGVNLTEEQFLLNLQYARDRWQPIGEVIHSIQLLLDLFKSNPLEDWDGCYEAEYTIPDFEALLWNLELLANRGNEVVRLNFI